MGEHGAPQRISATRLIFLIFLALFSQLTVTQALGGSLLDKVSIM